MNAKAQAVITTIPMQEASLDIWSSKYQLKTKTGEPVDKAGAYAVQGFAAAFIEHLSGSYSGVMGLPLYETSNLLKQHGVPIWQAATVNYE